MRKSFDTFRKFFNLGALKLTKQFYRRTDTTAVAEELLGCLLHVRTPEGICTGRIVETEAYCGREDRGCHAFGGRRTPRTEVMYLPGGVTYIYICYGIHQMFNIVTHVKDEPHAVLIRAVEPVSGIALMQQRRQTKELHLLARGPGLVGQAFQLDTRMNGLSLTGNDIWLTREPGFETGTVIKSPRVGMNFEGFYKTVPWRFRISGSQFTSPAR